MRSPKLIAMGTAGISMTPMIDVVFLLIIFFLVSSHLSKQENLVPLQLPSAFSGLDELSNQNSTTVHVQADGSWMIAGAIVGLQDIESILKRRISTSEQPIQLRIRTDKSVTYGQFSPILEVASQLGVGDLVFSVISEMQP